MQKQESSWSSGWRSSLAWMVIVVVVFTVIQGIRGGGHSLTAEVDDTRIGIVCDRNEPQFFLLSDLSDVQLVSDIGGLTSSGGTQDQHFAFGSFVSDTFGEVTVMAWTEHRAFIVLKLRDQTIIFNCANDRDTENKYKDILQAKEATVHGE